MPRTYLLKTSYKNKTKFKWSCTGSPKRWVSVVNNDGEWQVKEKEDGDVGERIAVKRVYYKKPGKRMVISTIEGNYIRSCTSK